MPLSPQQSDSETDVLQLTFRERQSGEFIVEFRAYAPLAAVRSGAIQLRCPEIQARLGQPFVITTIESDEYSIRPISMGTGELLPTIPLPAPAAAISVGSGLKSETGCMTMRQFRFDWNFRRKLLPCARTFALECSLAIPELK